MQTCFVWSRDENGYKCFDFYIKKRDLKNLFD